MNLIQLMLVIGDAINKLQEMGAVTADYKLVFKLASQWAEFAAFVESSLKKHGVALQDNVDQIIQMLPLVMKLAGVK